MSFRQACVKLGRGLGSRLFGKYRVLFNVDREEEEVTIILVGEKRGNSLFVRGQEFTVHHESDPAE